MHPDYYAMLKRIKDHNIRNILDLDDDETEIFGELERSKYVHVRESPYEHDYSKYSITSLGRRVLAEEDQRISDEQAALAYRARKDRCETIRYIITTVIAIIALIKSFWPEITAAAARLSILLAHR